MYTCERCFFQFNCCCCRFFCCRRVNTFVCVCQLYIYVCVLCICMCICMYAYIYVHCGRCVWPERLQESKHLCACTHTVYIYIIKISLPKYEADTQVWIAANTIWKKKQQENRHPATRSDYNSTMGSNRLADAGPPILIKVSAQWDGLPNIMESL